jgi:hypothetical protein
VLMMMASTEVTEFDWRVYALRAIIFIAFMTLLYQFRE